MPEVKQNKPEPPPQTIEEAQKIIMARDAEIKKLADATQLPVMGQSVQIRSTFAKTGYLGVDEFSYRERRQRYFQRRRALDDLYTIAFNVSDIRTAVLNLRNEIFRRGISFVPKFVRKCTNDNCEQEFQEDVKVCPTCNSPTREPNPRELKRISQHFREINKFGQSFVDVLKESEDDVQIVDDGFILLAKTYQLDDYGAHVRSRVDSVERLDPIFTEFDLDANGYPEQNTWFCLRHRDSVGKESGRCTASIKSNGTDTPCGMHLVPAMYKVRYRGKVLYYTRDEVVHYSKYGPSKTYGYSPIFSVYEKALTLIGMDRFLYDYFYERQLPVGILGIIGENAEALEEKRREWTMELEQNPHYVPILAIESQSGHGRVEWVKLGYTLQELDYLPIRDEIRQRIAGLYGVMAIFQGAPQDVRGAQSTQVQLVVQARVIEAAQTIYNEKVLPRFADAYGIEDYYIHLVTPEEQSEENAWRVKNLKAQYASALVQMGFSATLTPRGDFVFSGEGKRPGEANPLMGPTPFGTEGAGQIPGAGLPDQNQPVNKIPDYSVQPSADGEEGGSQDGYSMQSMLLEKQASPQPYGTIKLGDQLNSMTYQLFNSRVSELARQIKPWMTKQQAIAAVRKTIDEWRKTADEDSRRILRELMDAGLRQGMREGGYQPSPTKDAMVLKVLSETPTGFVPALRTFAEDARQHFEQVILDAFTNTPPDLQRMTLSMKRFVDEDADWRIQRIVRTEMSKLAGEGRLLAWSSDPEKETYEYHWIAKIDDRTKPISRVLAAGGPYTFEQIQMLWRDPTKNTALALGIPGAETIPDKETSDIYHQRCGIARVPKLGGI